MVHRLNISVPDDLFDRIEAVKEKVKVSKICQEALMNAVTVEELRNMAPEEEENLIARLRNQKEKNFDAWYGVGEKRGIVSARSLDLADFRMAEKVTEIMGQGPDDIEEVLYHLDGDYIKDSKLKDYLEECQEEDPLGFDRDAFLKGWFAGVLTVWEEIKDRI